MSWTEVFGIVFQSEGADKVKKDLDDVTRKTETFEEKQKRLLDSLTAGQKRAYNLIRNNNLGMIATFRATNNLFNHISQEQRDLVVDVLKADALSVLDKAEQATDNLTSSVKEEHKSIKKLVVTGAELLATYKGFKRVIAGVMGFARGGENIALMAQKAGISAELLQKYGYALKNYGGGMSSAASTLSKLNSQIQDLKFGKGGAIQNVALRYGISVYGKNGLATADEMLYNIARRMEKLNTQAQLDLGKKLGLDPATLALVQGGVKNLNNELEKASALTIYSDEDLRNSREFQRSLRELQGYLAKIGAIIWRFLLPPLKWVIDLTKNIFALISEHKSFVLGFLGALGAALGVIAVKSFIASLPLIAIIGALTAIGVAVGVLIDDFTTWLNGGESLFSGFWEWLEDTGNKILELGGKIKDFFKSLKFWGGDDEIEANITAGRGILSDTTTPLSTMTALQNATNTNNTVQVGEVNIQTQATDATGIADSITNALKLDFQSAMFENTGGVK